MSFYFPNVDPVFVYQRKGTTEDPYIFRHDTAIVSNNIVTLVEIPSYSSKVIVKKLDGTTLQEVTTDVLTINQYRVDYSTGIVYFHPSLELNKLTFDYYGTAYVSFPASRIWVDSNTNAQNKSIQQLVDDLDNNYKNNWKTAVNTYADIAITYPSPTLGDTVQTISDSKIYRFNGTSWIFTQQYSASAITDVQNKIGDVTILKTTTKNSLVASINEDHDEITQARGSFSNVKGRLDNLDTRTGSLNNLGTISKVNLVGAINENLNSIKTTNATLLDKANKLDVDTSLGTKADKTVAQMFKITDDSGGVKISISDTNGDILSSIVSAGKGLYTFYAISGSKNLPANGTSGSIRGIAQLTSTSYGWVYATDYLNNVYTNYYDSGSWRGWSSLVSDKLPIWINILLQNGWLNYGGSDTIAKYTKIGNVVFMKGVIKSGVTTTPTTIFTLPSGYRPSERSYCSTLNYGNSSVRMVIYPDGQVQIQGSNIDNTWIQIDNCFVADGN